MMDSQVELDVPRQLYVGGKFRDASDGGRFDVIDPATGLRLSERLESGMVGLNRGLVSDPAAPFGGVKQSGLGREGAHEGLLEFLETQYISVEW